MLAFRDLERRDFPLLAEWLAEPLVARWWNHEHTPGELERDFGPTTDGREPSQVFIASMAAQPFGLIQRYRIEAYPSYLNEISGVWRVPAASLSFDYLIGDAGFRGRGLGSAMIARFADLSWAYDGGAADIVVPVPAGNRASWRSLEAAGFVRVAAGAMEPDNRSDPPDHFVYHRHRAS